jgi:8-oxo-dGTP pyrophosphatase MutT (NUDIX family)
MTTEPAPAHLSATVLLLRNGGAGELEVFMVVRNYAIDFASGALVFPGGRVDRADHGLAADPHRCPPPKLHHVADQVTKVAAIRETFEECGILLARPFGSDRLVSGADLAGISARHRDRVHKSEITLAEVLAAEDLVLATDLLVPFAHWITPVGMPKRFDTHFFVAVAPEDQVGAHDGHESVDSVWISPGKAIEAVAAGTYKMVFATHLNILKLGRSSTAEAAMAAARTARVVTVMPEVVRQADGPRMLRLPAEADYSGTEFLAELPAAM